MNGKRILIIGAACGASFALAACAQLQEAEDFITSPETAQTVAVLTQVSDVIICDISKVAKVAGKVEQAAGADASWIGTTGKVAAGSATVCKALGGVAGATVKAPAGASVVTAATLTVQ